MERNADLKAALQNLEDTVKPGANVPGGIDTRIIMGFATVTKSIIRLEETSYFLSVVNIILAVLLALFAVLQIVIMLRGN